MQKIVMFAFISLGFFTSQLQGISLEQYIARHGMPQIQDGILDLYDQDLTDLDGLQNIPNIDQTVTLIVSDNRLGDNSLGTVSPTLLHGLPHLRDLDLRNNQLQLLPATVFDSLPNLQLLDLRNNQLQELPGSIFNNLHNLHTLVLANNRLQKLPSTIFHDLDNLKYLYLKDNFFNLDFMPMLTNMIRKIPTLQFLDGKTKHEALESYRIYNPKTLKQITAEYLIQNLELEQLEQLESHILDLLPLTLQQRTGIAAEKRRMGQ